MLKKLNQIWRLIKIQEVIAKSYIITPNLCELPYQEEPFLTEIYFTFNDLFWSTVIPARTQKFKTNELVYPSQAGTNSPLEHKNDRAEVLVLISGAAAVFAPDFVRSMLQETLL